MVGVICIVACHISHRDRIDADLEGFFHWTANCGKPLNMQQILCLLRSSQLLGYLFIIFVTIQVNGLRKVVGAWEVVLRTS
jgi:hypothetical protein